MSKLFKGIKSLFSTPAIPQGPTAKDLAKLVPGTGPRFPIPQQTDPELLEAQLRTRKNARKRRGRLSTILTDQTKEVVGSTGSKLGA